MSPDNPGVAIVRIAEDRGFVVCKLCEAIEDGNATCWACVDRWGWARGKTWHTELVATLRTRTPGKPIDVDEVFAFVQKLERLSK